MLEGTFKKVSEPPNIFIYNMHFIPAECGITTWVSM